MFGACWPKVFLHYDHLKESWSWGAPWFVFATTHNSSSIWYCMQIHCYLSGAHGWLKDRNTEVVLTHYDNREPKPKQILNPGARGLSSQFQLKPSFLPIPHFQIWLFFPSAPALLQLGYPLSLPTPACTPPSLASGDSIVMGAMPNASNAWCVFCTLFQQHG